MYLGEAPERSIYGEAKADDAKKLIDDGIPVMPLPFLPAKKNQLSIYFKQKITLFYVHGYIYM